MSNQTAFPSGIGNGETERSSHDQCEDEGSDAMDSMATSVRDLCVDVTHIKQPKELIYSEKPLSNIIAMCPISENRMWVMYIPEEENHHELKLFDAKGQVLKTVKDLMWYCSGFILIADNITLSWCVCKQTVLLIGCDGSITTHDIGFNVQYLASSATNDYQYLKKFDDSKLTRVTFGYVEGSQTGNLELSLDASQRKSPGQPQLTCREVEVVCYNTPPGHLLHVSQGGDYFAYVKAGKWCSRVIVYVRYGTYSFYPIRSYTPRKYISDARFWHIGGKDLLLLAVKNDNNIHGFSYAEANSPVLRLITAPLNLNKPQKLVIGCDQQVYIGCDGGKVVAVFP